MQAVLYTNDFEPITVVRLSPWAWDMLDRGQAVRLPVHMQLGDVTRPEAKDAKATFRTVKIVAEKVRRQGKTGLMLFSPDEENALLLRSVFLPGQRSELQEAERCAYAQGLLWAFERLGG